MRSLEAVADPLIRHVILGDERYRNWRRWGISIRFSWKHPTADEESCRWFHSSRIELRLTRNASKQGYLPLLIFQTPVSVITSLSEDITCRSCPPTHYCTDPAIPLQVIRFRTSFSLCHQTARNSSNHPLACLLN